MGVRAHSTRSMVASKAFNLGVALQDICAATGWSSPDTFVHFYNLDLASSPDILQICAVVSTIPAGATYSYPCHGMEGRYVTVNIPGTSMVLTLCEVEVYAIFPDNLAAGRNVTQSSTYGLWSAEHAIDFNPGLTKSWSACSSSNVQTNPWWSVDLSYIYRVSRVVITNRLDCCPERINGAEIRIGNSLENNGNNNPICAVISSIPAGVSSTYICNDMEGRYLNLIIPGDSRILTLCEVEVYGEGPLMKKTFVKMKLKSSSSLSEPAVRVQLLSQGCGGLNHFHHLPLQSQTFQKDCVGYLTTELPMPQFFGLTNIQFQGAFNQPSSDCHVVLTAELSSNPNPVLLKQLIKVFSITTNFQAGVDQAAMPAKADLRLWDFSEE
ncbi:uncharacterized protein LOC109075246 [Cyprinus carpio]|uniref:Uncharacterized protein LOC109075246 n=1 Tax=Cyprinus carpio TaxID=7962 RepID=A0A9R0AY94_CYPCA|nr:uncharacterized protein LOC109075246 [Cyprinus carpio]